MKIIYILGLEHSGTTLTDCLLSSAKGAIGLGEVANFFSRSHMAQYHQKWGKLDDAYLCSCGAHLSHCDFWRTVCDVSGLTGEGHLIEQYSSLLSAAKRVAGDNAVIIDSSKSPRGFDNWLSCATQLNIPLSNMHLIFAFKDPRSFAASMRKKQAKPSTMSTFRHFNYWVGANKALLDYAQSTGVGIRFSSYEKLCSDVQGTLHKLAKDIIDDNNISGNLDHTHAHIGIGNKSFIMRNREQIKYDNTWESSLVIQYLYHLHLSAKKLNSELTAFL